MESAIGFQVRNKAFVSILLILFLRNILFRSKTASRDKVHQQWCAACKYQNIGKPIVFKRINKLQSPLRKEFRSQLCSYYIKSRNFIGKYYFQLGFQPVYIASSASKSIWNVNASGWEKLHSLKFIFTCHVKTVTLMIFLKLFVQVCAIPEVVSDAQS